MATLKVVKEERDGKVVTVTFGKGRKRYCTLDIENKTIFHNNSHNYTIDEIKTICDVLLDYGIK